MQIDRMERGRSEMKRKQTESETWRDCLHSCQLNKSVQLFLKLPVEM